MKKILALTGLSTAIILSTGCSSTSILESGEAEIAYETKHERVSRELSNDWGNTGLSGAAYNQPAYIHTLGGDFNGQPSVSVATGRNQSAENKGNTLKQSDMAGVVSRVQNIDKFNMPSRGYSVYELSRWERFCDSGKGMDEADWLFVQKEGPTNLPTEIYPNCKQPGYSHQTYIATWIDYCQGQELDKFHKNIIKNSVRPTSLKELCKF